MTEHKMVFICGLHRSGTSILFKCLRDHPEISGFHGTGVPEDEGQHLQTVYPTAKTFGGPGRFGFEPEAYMDENSPLATAENREKLMAEWSQYWEMEKAVLIEKSPPNLIRTRFLQALFPNAYFITVTRHPLAVTFATYKWKRKVGIDGLLEHWFVCHERFEQDAPHLHNAMQFKYETFVAEPQATLDRIYEFVGLESAPLKQEIRTGINDKYFGQWQEMRQSLLRRFTANKLVDKYEAQANHFGYSLENLDQ